MHDGHKQHIKKKKVKLNGWTFGWRSLARLAQVKSNSPKAVLKLE